MPSLKTVRGWENDFKVKLDYDVTQGKVECVQCQVCKRWEKRILNCKNFSRTWIVGTKSVKKDGLSKHVQSEQHKEASNIQSKSDMGAIPYLQSIVEETPIGKGLARMADKDRENMRVKFNSAYYLAKKERPFRDYPDLLNLQIKNSVPKFGESYANERAAAVFTDYIAAVEKEELAKALAEGSYFSVLSDGSTDNSVQEQELVYVLFLYQGKPRVTFLDIETPKSCDAEGIFECITKAFKRIGLEKFTDRLCGINVDGASVNLGKHRGVATRLKEVAPWLLAVHCFNHRLELGVKDAFTGFPIKAFEDIDEMLLKLYYYYQKSPKRLRDLRSFAEEFGETVPKPTKACGTRWINHKWSAMKIALENYGKYIGHLTEISADNAEMQGFLKKWSRARIPFQLAIYLDILSPIRRLSLGMQDEKHDPVKQVRRIQEFDLIMEKLKKALTGSFDEDNNDLTYYKRLIRDIVEGEDGHVYQRIKLTHYENSIEDVKYQYTSVINLLIENIQSRFSNLQDTAVFRNIVRILDVKTWPNAPDSSFLETELTEIVEEFNGLLSRNDCDISLISSEWITLQQHLIPTVANNPKEHYLDIWRRMFVNANVKSECKNVLHIIEILLCTPFTNAKVERGFSRMARVKSDFRSQLSRGRLAACFRISEEGRPINEFKPDAAIDLWYSEKVRRLGSSKHKYTKRKTTKDCQITDLSSLSISDLESESDGSDNDKD